jgi:hypothetical protein
MRKRVSQDFRQARTVLVCFPDLDVEYRFTDEVYAVGDRLRHNGEVWFVTSVQEGSLGGGQAMVTCQRSPSDTEPRRDEAPTVPPRRLAVRRSRPSRTAYREF